MREPTTLSSWTGALCRQLDSLGLDSQALCRAAGVQLPSATQAPCRLPLSATSRLWTLAVQHSGNPALGLDTSRFVWPTTFHALGLAIVASDNLLHVFQRITRYYQVVTDALAPTLQADGDSYLLSLRQPSDSAAPHPAAVDAFLAIYVRTCRQRLGRDYAPQAVLLRRPAPSDPSPWHNTFRAPVQFAAAVDGLRFGRADLLRPLTDGHPQLAAHNEALLERELALLQRPWSQRVEAQISQHLAAGEPSAERIAERLCVSLRSLQRHLQEEQRSFEQLLAGIRQRLACEHLADPRLSISEVAYLLGFADSSSFSRAFRRWLGCSPSQWRAHHAH